MPEPFKNWFNPKMIAQMGDHLRRANSSFQNKQFVKLATNDLDALELKERSAQICSALQKTLPPDFRKACETMLKSLHPEDDVDLSGTDMDDRGIRGWAIMPMADFVANEGLEDFDFAMDVLKELTKRSSSEFAIRAFFLHDTPRALKHVMEWTTDPNFHVRRLASEGSRPRLPWGAQLPEFIANPTPLFAVLERLKDDPEEYVRRSVANNLNDIAKDHPNAIAMIAAKWLKGAGKDRQRLVKHACRTLIKQGHQPTLNALGYTTPMVSAGPIELVSTHVKLGGNLEFSVAIQSTADSAQPLIIDYVIHHMKANGTLSPKTFKWKTLDLGAGQVLKATKKHAIKPITTRTYHAGRHQLEIQINGESFGWTDFELEL